MIGIAVNNRRYESAIYFNDNRYRRLLVLLLLIIGMWLRLILMGIKHGRRLVLLLICLKESKLRLGIVLRRINKTAICLMLIIIGMRLQFILMIIDIDGYWYYCY